MPLGSVTHMDWQGTWQFMSALVQNDPTRVVVIADELESILHVLIFFSIRFLPHNLKDSDVPQFLHDYFDDFSPNSRGARSGMVKRNAVKHGKIELDSYSGDPTGTGGTILKFIWPSEETLATGETSFPLDFSHPLNDFLVTLLSWFQAHYAVNDSLHNAPTSDPNPNVRRAKARVPRLDDDDLKHRPRRNDVSQPSPAESSSLQQTPFDERTMQLAAKLHTHDDILDLFVQTLQRDWPDADKVPDKQPKDGLYKNKDLAPSEWEPPEYFLDAEELEAMEVQNLLDTGADDEAEAETEYATDDEEAEEDDEAEEEEVEETLFDITGSDWAPDSFALPQPTPSRPSTPINLIEYSRKRPLEEPRTPLNKRSRS